MAQSISAKEVLWEMRRNPDDFSLLDVRSEGEFAKGALPFSQNIPILNNSQRAQVGTAYKNTGRDFAIELGHKLVGSQKAEKCRYWKNELGDKNLRWVCCWRGGLRSQIAQQWIKEAGLETSRIEGGYQALRKQLISSSGNLPEMLILTGPTGSGKTDLLKALSTTQVIDLEKLAQHRGSAFGSHLKTSQPSQATFENHLYWKLFASENKVVLEDESQLIGRCAIPKSVHKKMASAPRVVLEVPLEIRIKNIYEEYVLSPSQNMPQDIDLLSIYTSSLAKIKKKLGGLLFSKIEKSMAEAFLQDGLQISYHADWIGSLLEDYYDKYYHQTLEMKTGPTVFRGDWEDCRIWLDGQTTDKPICKAKMRESR